MRKNALIIYLFVLVVLAGVIALTLANHPGILAGITAGIGFVSAITSLAPFFISRYLFKKAEPHTHYRRRYQIAAITVYFFCFPVKIWSIVVMMYFLVNGEGPAFGWN
ncbi:hypothetical protein [Fluviicola taffensis]|uniref:hypothetical protein n=1 Tax=Fluviicola taffensis TaxID=191579 RepID=UPI0031380A89